MHRTPMAMAMATALACSARAPTMPAPPRPATRPAAEARAADAAARELANLRAFARVYGYVRWFHPSDEASEVDWTALAVYGAGAVRDASDAGALRAALTRLFEPVAPTLRLYAAGEPAPDPSRLTPADTAGLTTVAWQHAGLGGYGQPPPYFSKRSHRPMGVALEGGFETAWVVQAAPVAALRGREVRLRAAARLAGPSDGDRGLLWLRAPRPAAAPAFVDLGDRPVTARAWTEAAVTLAVPADATALQLGAQLEGIGPAHFDDLTLEVRGADGGWTPTPLVDAGFEAGAAGWKPMGAGYEVEAREAAARTGAKGLEIGRKLAAMPVDEPLFPPANAVGDVVDAEVGPGLRVQVPLALYSRDGRTLGASPQWPALRAALAADRERRPAAYASLDHPDLRAAAVVVAWNALQHFYPYFDVVPVDWDAALTTALAGARTAADERAFVHVLGRMLAGLADGHGHVGAPAVDATLGTLPIRLVEAEGAIVVAASASPAALRGDVVERVDGAPAAAWLAEVEARCSGSPQARRAVALAEATSGPRGQRTRLELRRGAEVVAAELTYGDEYAPWDPLGPPIERLPDGVYVVDLARADWPSIERALPALAAAPGVVIDVRDYAQEQTHTLVRHLLRAPDRVEVMGIPWILRPDHAPPAGWTMAGFDYEVHAPRLTGKVAWLIGPGTQSYLETIMETVEHYHLGEIVGTPSSGANGNVVRFRAPGGLELRWTGMRVTRHDGSPFHTLGVRPTVPQARTLAGVREGRDEVRERGLEVVRAR